MNRKANVKSVQFSNEALQKNELEASKDAEAVVLTDDQLGDISAGVKWYEWSKWD
jgi:hypothetical protein